MRRHFGRRMTLRERLARWGRIDPTILFFAILVGQYALLVAALIALYRVSLTSPLITPLSLDTSDMWMVTATALACGLGGYLYLEEAGDHAIATSLQALCLLLGQTATGVVLGGGWPATAAWIVLALLWFGIRAHLAFLVWYTPDMPFRYVWRRWRRERRLFRERVERCADRGIALQPGVWMNETYRLEPQDDWERRQFDEHYATCARILAMPGDGSGNTLNWNELDDADKTLRIKALFHEICRFAGVAPSTFLILEDSIEADCRLQYDAVFDIHTVLANRTRMLGLPMTDLVLELTGKIATIFIALSYDDPKLAWAYGGTRMPADMNDDEERYYLAHVSMLEKLGRPPRDAEDARILVDDYWLREVKGREMSRILDAVERLSAPVDDAPAPVAH